MFPHKRWVVVLDSHRVLYAGKVKYTVVLSVVSRTRPKSNGNVSSIRINTAHSWYLIVFLMMNPIRFNQDCWLNTVLLQMMECHLAVFCNREGPAIKTTSFSCPKRTKVRYTTPTKRSCSIQPKYQILNAPI